MTTTTSILIVAAAASAAGISAAGISWLWRLRLRHEEARYALAAADQERQFILAAQIADTTTRLHTLADTIAAHVQTAHDTWAELGRHATGLAAEMHVLLHRARTAGAGDLQERNAALEVELEQARSAAADEISALRSRIAALERDIEAGGLVDVVGVLERMGPLTQAALAARLGREPSSPALGHELLALEGDGTLRSGCHTRTGEPVWWLSSGECPVWAEPVGSVSSIMDTVQQRTIRIPPDLAAASVAAEEAS